MTDFAVTIYRQVAQYAVVTIEAGSEEEAMKLAPFEDDPDWREDDVLTPTEILKIEETRA